MLFARSSRQRERHYFTGAGFLIYSKKKSPEGLQDKEMPTPREAGRIAKLQSRDKSSRTRRINISKTDNIT